jgi:hypothetical protein
LAHALERHHQRHIASPRPNPRHRRKQRRGSRRTARVDSKVGDAGTYDRGQIDVIDARQRIRRHAADHQPDGVHIDVRVAQRLQHGAAHQLGAAQSDVAPKVFRLADAGDRERPAHAASRTTACAAWAPPGETPTASARRGS